jgi:hypothetical protein
MSSRSWIHATELTQKIVGWLVVVDGILHSGQDPLFAGIVLFTGV